MVKLSKLQEIVYVPQGATSFHTEDNKIVFIIGATGDSVTRPLDDNQLSLLKDLNLLGPFGHAIDKNV